MQVLQEVDLWEISSDEEGGASPPQIASVGAEVPQPAPVANAPASFDMSMLIKAVMEVKESSGCNFWKYIDQCLSPLS